MIRILLVFAASILLLGAGRQAANLTEDHRVWLEEEVVYIITEAEREVFGTLESHEEREHFIDAFWLRRDPVPATRENEFRIEHYERLDYANRFFSRDAPRPGWATDRGKYWIILGKPRTREIFEGRNEVVGTDLWIYDGDTSMGLPPRFNLLFFRENDIGEFQLYNPMADGPDALVQRGELLRNRQHFAVDMLEMVSMDLARASLVIDLTDPNASFLSATNTRAPRLDTVRPSMSVGKNLLDITNSPMTRVDTEEIEGYLRYGDRVTAEYSFRFVKSASDFRVLLGPRNTPFIHYTIQLAPEDFTLELDEEARRYRTTLDVELELRTAEGQLLAIHRNEPVVELTESQHASLAGAPFAYRDNLPVIPGDYEVSVILRNRATTQYTVATAEVRAPATGAGSVGFADPVLAYGADVAGSGARALDFGTYQFGSRIFEPSLDGSFAQSDTLILVAQAVNAGAEYETRVRFAPDEAGAESPAVSTVVEQKAPAGSSRSPATFELGLEQLSPGRYRAGIELVAPDGTVADSREVAFLVSPRAEVTRPGLVIRRSFATHAPGLLALALGDQFLANGRIREATLAYREASANPDLVQANWKLASALLFTRDADGALELLLPLESDHPNEIEVVEGIGFAYYIRGECRPSLDRLEHALNLRAPDTSLLNALGDCYEQEGNEEQARAMFERSLGLNPEQEGVRARLAGYGASR